MFAMQMDFFMCMQHFLSFSAFVIAMYSNDTTYRNRVWIFNLDWYNLKMVLALSATDLQVGYV